MADEEFDFDDPRFLIETPVPAKELSYAEKRKRKLAESYEKSRSHSNNRTRKQKEEDAREEGLRTNLIAKDTEEGGESKALKMMKGMGFTPGEGLGKKRKMDDEEESVASGSALPTQSTSRGGIGSGGAGLGSASASMFTAGLGSRTAPRAPSPPSLAVPKPRTEPIKFQMRQGRTGLGVPGSTPAPTSFPAHLLAEATLAAASKPLPDIKLYLSRNKDLFNDRKATGVLRSVRKTLEELDRRNGMEESVMWLAPEDAVREEKWEKRKRAYKGGDVDPEEEWGVDVEGERKEEDARRKNGDLAYEKGLSATVVEDEDGSEEREEDKLNKEEREEWLSFPSPVRLALTLAYLRTTYNYCFWCGCQYNDVDDLKTSCPGEDEGDH